MMSVSARKYSRMSRSSSRSGDARARVGMSYLLKNGQKKSAGLSSDACAVKLNAGHCFFDRFEESSGLFHHAVFLQKLNALLRNAKVNDFDADSGANQRRENKPYNIALFRQAAHDVEPVSRRDVKNICRNAVHVRPFASFEAGVEIGKNAICKNKIIILGHRLILLVRFCVNLFLCHGMRASMAIQQFEKVPERFIGMLCSVINDFLLNAIINSKKNKTIDGFLVNAVFL
nr:MAG TPA: hypothetical protein [Caudoviricetes sp.]